MARAFAILVWAAVAASAVFWGWKVSAGAPSMRTSSETAAPPRNLQGDLTRLLGADSPRTPNEPVPAPAEPSRFQLIGVIAPRQPGAARQGVALMVVDGKPARAYRVGSELGADRVLQAVHMRGVAVASRAGAPLIVLELPAQPLPATDPFAAAVPGNALPAAQTRPAKPTVQPDPPPNPASRRGPGAAPNTLLNNPSEMAPPDTTGSDGSASR